MFESNREKDSLNPERQHLMGSPTFPSQSQPVLGPVHYRDVSDLRFGDVGDIE